MLLALVLGLLTNLAFEPFGYYPVVFITLALLFGLWGAASPGHAAIIGFAFGFGFFAFGINWLYISVHEFGSASPVLAGAAVVILACIMSTLVAFGGFMQARFSSSPALRYLALLPSVWVVVEWVRGWLFTGFPWLYVGYSQTDSWLAGWAPVFGVLGVSLTVCVIAGSLTLLLVRHLKILPVAAIVLAVAVGWAGTKIEWSSGEGEPISVAVVQGNVSVVDKWNRQKALKLLDYFVSESENLANSDIVIWPEIALPFVDTRLEKIQLWDVLMQSPAEFLVGTLEERTAGGETYYHNSAYAISSDSIQKYRKSRLVPFGEFTPFRSLLGWLEELVFLPASDMSAYTHAQQPLELAGRTAGVSICYEDAFPGEILKMLPAAEFLINISEDAWFGERLAPHQRLQMSKMRAIEAARPVIRAANKGISASIDHRGKVIDELTQAKGNVLQTAILPTRGTTPFVRFGFTPLLIVCGLMIAMSLTRRKD